MDASSEFADSSFALDASSEFADSSKFADSPKVEIPIDERDNSDSSSPVKVVLLNLFFFRVMLDSKEVILSVDSDSLNDPALDAFFFFFFFFFFFLDEAVDNNSLIWSSCSMDITSLLLLRRASKRLVWQSGQA